MVESKPSPWEQDLTKIRDACIEGMKTGKNDFELVIIPITGLTPETLPKGFSEAVRKYCRLRPNTPIFPQYLYLLPYYVSPARRGSTKPVMESIRGIHPRIETEQPRHYLLSLEINGTKKQFGVLLRSPSLRIPDGKLSDGEQTFLRFVDFAGKLLTHHKAVSSPNAERAWIEFLLRDIWTHAQPAIRDGQAKLRRLWEQSLAAIDRSAFSKPTAKRSSRGRPTEDGPNDERVCRMWKSGTFRSYKELADELKLSSKLVTLIIRKHDRRSKRRVDE